MSFLDNKCKAIQPEDTIKNIKNFFEKRNCKIIEEKNFQSEDGTFSCTLGLYFNGHFILRTNGKGVTKIYSEASGHAELYERFCAYQLTCGNQLNLLRLTENNYKQNGYYYDKDEKCLSYEELLEEPNTKYLLKNYLPKLSKKYIDEYYSAYANEKIIGLKYKSIEDDNHFIYYTQLLTPILGTAGLAAGNTEEEALVQGSSEIFEKYLTVKFFQEEQDCYYYINKDSLPQYLKDIVKKIEDKGFEVYIYDLSYNYQMPVCLVFIIDKEHHSFYKNFGAFPIIEIAIERCFTEIYQGIQKLQPWNQENLPLCLATEKTAINYLFNNSGSKQLIPEKMILNSKPKNLYDSDIYIKNNENMTNTLLLNHIKQICKNINMKLYFKNISLCKEIQAVHIITDKILFKAALDDWKWRNFYQESEYVKLFDTGYSFINLFKKVVKKEINKDDINNELIKIMNSTKIKNNIELYEFLARCWRVSINTDLFNPYMCLMPEPYQSWDIFTNKISLLFDHLGPYSDTDFYKTVEPLYLYYLYYKDNKYSHEEILKILSFLGYDNINIDPNNFTPRFFIEEIFTNFLQKEYNSSEYNDFINLFIKKPKDFE